MRTREIKPSFFLNDELCKLPPLTRILYQGYWCLADSRGVIEYRPDRIKVVILPYDDCDVREMTLQLVTSNFLHLHDNPDGESFIIVQNFTKHQNPHPNEKKKVDQPYKRLKYQDNISLSEKEIICNDKQPSDPAFSLSPYLNKNKQKNPMPDAVPPSFETFWKCYPKKVARDAALKAYVRSLKRADSEAIGKGLALYCKHWNDSKIEKRFIPNPATWLNEGRWKDELDSKTVPNHRGNVPVL